MLAAFFYRALSFHKLLDILIDSARSSAAVGLVIGGALILNYIVASENIPNLLASHLVGLDIDPLVFLLCVNLLLLLLGCLLDATTIILVIIPLFLPACRELGIDLVHFGVIAVVNCMIGLITPPYGILLFVINAFPGWYSGYRCNLDTLVDTNYSGISVVSFNSSKTKLADTSLIGTSAIKRW